MSTDVHTVSIVNGLTTEVIAFHARSGRRNMLPKPEQGFFQGETGRGLTPPHSGSVGGSPPPTNLQVECVHMLSYSHEL